MVIKMGYIAVQIANLRDTLAVMCRGESFILRAEKDWKIDFNSDGDFIVNNINVGKSLKATTSYMHKINFEYYFRKRGIMYRYWRDRPMDIRKYFPEPVEPKNFVLFYERNKAMLICSLEVINFCRNCAAVRTESPRDHHPNCYEYLDQDKYPEYNHVNPIGICPECQSEDGLSIDSCREMQVSVIDCGDCGFRYEGKCPEDVLEKRFKKKYKKKQTALN